MTPEAIYRRYRDLQTYAGWSEDDPARVAALGGLVELYLPGIVEDFYAEIERHPEATKVITGGADQTARLKSTLKGWLKELFSGRYDQDYVTRRWRVGARHVEIGLEQVYTNVALSRIRQGLTRAVLTEWRGPPEGLFASLRAVNTLLDLDLALIEDAYQAEHLARLQRSERQAALAQLALAKARSEAVFRTLVEAAPCLILLLRPDLTLIYFNQFAECVTGYQAAEVVGRNFATVFVAEQYRELAQMQIGAVLSGGHARDLEGPVRCRDGTRRWVLWNAERLSEYEGAPAVLAIGQDITALRSSQERILQAERLAAIGQMMTGLAHESGNALARSQACLEMLALEVQDRPDALDLVQRVSKAQNHLQQLYDEVRNYAAPVKLEREPWAIDTVWRQAWANLAVQREGREAHLSESCAGVNLSCLVDPFRMEQVFRNVFENSLTAARGPVAVQVICREVAHEGAPALHISVKDSGPGLTPEARGRLFEPFFTTKTKGTGLGMAIAKRLVEAHGGRIFAGDGGPGAEIVIILPRGGP